MKPASFYKTEDISGPQFGNYSCFISGDHSHLPSAHRALGNHHAFGAYGYPLFDLQADLGLLPFLQVHLA
jgi:hypothetical protein